ncbi:hypothetical protein K501DRAFT_279936 [Backusella circina FSU 941]|nr:hypothetical protein K501DRAFT_279936 [Backusella circina FSU 941]
MYVPVLTAKSVIDICSFALYALAGARKNCLKPSTYESLKIFLMICCHQPLQSRFMLGESVAQSTKQMEIMAEGETYYGRRIGLFVKSKKYSEKDGISNNIMYQQQSINAYILNDINLLLHHKNNDIVYYDFEGKRSYLAQLFNYENYLVTYKIGSFIIPKTLQQRGNTRASITNLFYWKEAVINNSNNGMTGLIKEDEEHSLVDIANDIVSPITPHSNVGHVQIHLSPSKGSKRTHSVFINNK